MMQSCRINVYITTNDSQTYRGNETESNAAFRKLRAIYMRLRLVVHNLTPLSMFKVKRGSSQDEISWKVISM